ncbi:serrate RNA effector molecule homolog [Helianthus annuus]|uniref:serrate RNA effector molecule homolog n=1 Tax=Helianthus annuus TaxID=4232 RepID=UPI000B8EF282|nr:serrate RNA effector molecule homolog [Helianthus annuus]
MAEEFYNTFFNAFTSESSEVTTVTPKTITKAINENIKHDNFYGTHSKPPTLESIEDYTWWKERFINWAKAYAHESWFCLEYGYEKPKDDKGEDLQFKKFSRDDRAEFAAEQRMIALIQSAIRNDIFALLNHSGTSKSVWEALQEDRNDIVRKTAHGKATTAPRKFANVAEIKEEKEPAKNHEEKIENKEKTREEILSEKTHKERDVVYRRMDEMQEEYENAVSNKRWDKKRECFYNREGEPVAEEVETEAVKVEAVKEVEEQQIEEEEMKDVKSDAGDVGEEVSVEQKLNDAEMKRPEEAENTEAKMNFVQGTSSEEEKELKFRQQSNEEFQAQKKQQQQVFLKKTECQPKEK